VAKETVCGQPAVLNLREALWLDPYDANRQDIARHSERRLLDPQPIELRKHIASARLREPGPDPARPA
jgi:hypothetical protein